MIYVKKVLRLLACCALASLPFVALWIEFPVTFKMRKISTVMESIKVEEKNEVVDTGIAFGSVDCIYLDIAYKVLPNGPVVAGATKRKICDRLAAIDFVKKYKNRPVEGYWTEGVKFVPTGTLEWREFLLRVALSIVLLLVSLAGLNAVMSNEKNEVLDG